MTLRTEHFATCDRQGCGVIDGCVVRRTADGQVVTYPDGWSHVRIDEAEDASEGGYEFDGWFCSVNCVALALAHFHHDLAVIVLGEHYAQDPAATQLAVITAQATLEGVDA